MSEAVECCCGRMITQDFLTEEWTHLSGDPVWCWPEAGRGEPDADYKAEPAEPV